VLKGGRSLPVVTAAGFKIGDLIRIGDHTSEEEDNAITGFGSITLERPLQFDHGVNTEIIIIHTCESYECPDDMVLRESPEELRVQLLVDEPSKCCIMREDTRPCTTVAPVNRSKGMTNREKIIGSTALAGGTLVGTAVGLLSGGVYNAAKHPEAPATATTLTAAVQAGQMEMAVLSTTDFMIGCEVRIQPDSAYEEKNWVADFGSLILAAPLKFDHRVGTRVILVECPVEGASTTTPPPIAARVSSTIPNLVPVESTPAPEEDSSSSLPTLGVVVPVVVALLVVIMIGIGAFVLLSGQKKKKSGQVTTRAAKGQSRTLHDERGMLMAGDSYTPYTPRSTAVELELPPTPSLRQTPNFAQASFSPVVLPSPMGNYYQSAMAPVTRVASSPMMGRSPTQVVVEPQAQSLLVQNESGHFLPVYIEPELEPYL
jgi:hypothetical protein